MQIKDVLDAKTHTGALTIAPDASVRDLLAVLAEHNIGALVVSGDGRAVAGIVSERDVVRHLQRDETVLDAPVSTIMTTTVVSGDGGDDVVGLMRLMTDRRIRHVPVLDGEQLVGVISIGDVVKHRIEQLEQERDHLESYVHQT
ncbi:signal transduction protein [Marmoricola endophyticus]|uniref:Signal transduction protein n=2 Tax=Marmoricola endophyticus TaxID=2040280 RepID=A0A917BGH1_9ACTN|nr:signal transduction protein [Marmoricola endophyticus]